MASSSTTRSSPLPIETGTDQSQVGLAGGCATLGGLLGLWAAAGRPLWLLRCAKVVMGWVGRLRPRSPLSRLIREDQAQTDFPETPSLSPAILEP